MRYNYFIYFAFLIPALLLPGCHKQNNYWELDKLQTGIPKYDSAKVESNPQDPSTLQLQIVQTESDLNFYLISRTFVFPSNKGNIYYCPLTLIVENEKPINFLSERHAGGYRLKIPLEYGKIMVEGLLSKKTVTLKSGENTLVLHPEGFEKKFRQMLKFSLLDLPVSFGL